MTLIKLRFLRIVLVVVKKSRLPQSHNIGMSNTIISNL